MSLYLELYPGVVEDEPDELPAGHQVEVDQLYLKYGRFSTSYADSRLYLKNVSKYVSMSVIMRRLALFICILGSNILNLKTLYEY